MVVSHAKNPTNLQRGTGEPRDSTAQKMLAITNPKQRAFSKMQKLYSSFSASAAAMAPVKKLVAKGGKKEKQVLKLTLDGTHPVEDRVRDAANFKLFLQESISVNRKAENFGGGV